MQNIKNLKILAFAATFTSLLTTPLTGFAHGHEDGKPTLGFKTEQISGNVYMLSGVGGFTGGNIGLTIGDDGVAMIDNGLPSVLELLRAEVAKTTDKPIDYLINTHIHGDHIGNNAAFGGEDTRIISHQNLRQSLVQNGVAVGGGKTEPASKDYLPVLTFSDQLTLHINDDAAKIQHFSSAHTDGDAVIMFEAANVIHTGDIMFNGMFPYIDTDNGGSYKGVIAALQGIHDMANDDTKIIPGHGPLANKADVANTIAMLKSAHAAVKKLVDAGKSDEQVLADNPLEPFSSYHWNFITTEIMTKQVLKSLR